MCEDSINIPIIRGDKTIGIITESKISKTGNGLISFGKIWNHIDQEIIKGESGNYIFSATIIK